MKRIIAMILWALLSIMVFSGCQLYHYNYQDNVVEYAMITESDDLSKLDEYPNLEYVDLRGSTCYDAIIAYAETHPDVTVRYNVAVGESRLDQAESDATLNGYEIDFELMLQNLKYLPDLKSVHVNQLMFSIDQINELTGKYPHIDFSYTVDLCGHRYENTVEELDLAYMTSDDIEETIRTVSLLPQLRQVNLVSPSGDGNLAVADVMRLSEACPEILFNYEFYLFGQRVSTLSTELKFDSVPIGNEGIEEVRNALSIMKQCRSVQLDSCGIDNELMAQLRSEFPDQNVAWRIFAGRFSMMTDEIMVRMNFTLNDDQAEVLKYCTNVKFLDLSNSKITHIDFASNMQDLECVVLSSTSVGDLSSLSNCPNLTWLELYNCGQVKELAPLSGLTNLKYLNISGTRVSNLTALDNLPLERLSCVKSAVKDDGFNSFAQKHPDCMVTTKGVALDYGWRYNDKRQQEPHPYYAAMQDIFRYNEKSFRGNTKES